MKNKIFLYYIMPLQVIQYEEPKLKVCKMKCDDELDKKLNKYELTKLLNEHSTISFIGAPKSGKTNLLYSFFKSKEIFFNVFENIFLFQPESSNNSMSDNIFNEIPDEQKFEELNITNLNHILEYIKEEDYKYNTCIIFDDVGSQLKNADIEKTLKKIQQNRRHLHITSIFLQQTYYSMPKDIRKLYSKMFIFKVSRMEMETIFKELVETKKKYIDDILEIVYDKPYEYLFLDVVSQRTFKKFNEIIVVP